MQAGELLSYADPFTGKRQVEDEEQVKLFKKFVSICDSVLARYPEHIRTTVRLEDDGLVTVMEGSYKVESSDGSYLHVLVFGHNDNDGVIDLGISLIEHTDEGVSRGGYMYILEEDGLIRDSCYAGDIDSDEPDTHHFSVIDEYYFQDELNQLEGSTDEHDLDEVRQIRQAVQKQLEFSEFAETLGANRQPPKLEELKKLKKILKSAVPFEIPR